MTAIERIFGFLIDAECKCCGDFLTAGEVRPIPVTWSIGKGVLCPDCAETDPAKSPLFHRCPECRRWTFSWMGSECCSRIDAAPAAKGSK